MAKRDDTAGFQQAAGLVRYFEAEEESAIHLDPRMLLAFCGVLAVVLIVINAAFPPGSF